MPGRSRIVAAVIWVLVIVAVLAAMGALTVAVLLPFSNDPESKLYRSALGYPARQRWTGAPIEVATAPAQRIPLTDYAAAAGESVALQQIDMRALVAGVVESVDVVEGQWVRKGDSLVKLRRAPFEDAVEHVRTQLAQAELTLASYPKTQAVRRVELEAKLAEAGKLAAIAEERLAQFRTLKKDAAASTAEIANAEEKQATRRWELTQAEQSLARFHVESPQELATARLTKQQKEIDVRKALRDLENTWVRAPEDSMASAVKIHRGESAVPETVLLELNADVVFKAYLDQARPDAVKLGDRAVVRLVAHPGRTFSGVVFRLNPTVQGTAQRSSRVGIDRSFTYSAWIRLDGLRMPPGLQGYAEFGRPNDVLAVPESAIVHLSSGEGMVMVVRDGMTVVREVRLGPARGNRREVLEGLQAAEEVVLHPEALKPNDRVSVGQRQPEQRPVGVARP